MNASARAVPEKVERLSNVPVTELRFYQAIAYRVS